MRNLSNPAEINMIMSKHGFRLSKALGQNFIIDPDVCPKIAEMSGAECAGVLEIGPGIGVLTAELCKRAKKVIAIEIDKRLLPVLGETLSDFNNVEVINADVLELDLNAIIEDKFVGLDVVVCANLPYYITSPIIMMLLETRLRIKSITVMVQKEAAERICADFPSREAGAVTAAVRWYSEPELLFEVQRESFMPSPDVTSAVVRLAIRENPPFPVRDEEMFFRVVKGAFSQRRKTILNCLSSFFSMNKTMTGDILDIAGVSASSRAEQLALSDFAKIADLLAK